MKLLFDHNLSYKLVGRLADLFPDSEHVRNVNLHEADDRTVWEYARAAWDREIYLTIIRDMRTLQLRNFSTVARRCVMAPS